LPRSRPTLRLVTCGALLALALSGCEAGGPLMMPGENCMSCHSSLTVAGTVFSRPDDPADGGLAGVVVTVTDANGAQTVLTSNEAGNFYTHAALALPLARASVSVGGQVTSMNSPPGGACNSCHQGLDGGQGRLHAP
jgi:cytochrome c peroxidase